MNKVHIRVEGLSKRYRLGSKRERYLTLRDSLVKSARSAWRRARDLFSTDAPGVGEKWFWALKDVSLEVKEGEVVGVIGRNGAGKSTLLKILSQVTEPTEGWAELDGRVGSMLEVGTGFHPELTGRENIYLSGAILGMKKFEIDRKFDEIVAFADIDRFLDTPCKHYSSGMYVRLGFAVAAHLEPEILLVDEVLAVGDAAFQRKCLGKMGEVAKGGRTVLFVSHNMAAVTGLCSRGILIDEGHLAFDGRTSEAVDRYIGTLRKVSPRNGGLAESPSGLLRLCRLDVIDDHGNPANPVICGQDTTFLLELEPQEQITNTIISIGVDTIQGHRVCLLANVLLAQSIALESPRTIVACRVPVLPLSPGNYTLSIKITGRSEVLIWCPHVAILEVVGGDFFKTGKLLEESWVGTTLVPHTWFVRDRNGLPEET
jgi:lipopolysaccharide transport system ATP-binding protein